MYKPPQKISHYVIMRLYPKVEPGNKPLTEKQLERMLRKLVEDHFVGEVRTVEVMNEEVKEPVRAQ